MKFFGDFFTFLKRILLVYGLLMACRVAFYFFNIELLGSIKFSEIPMLIKGALVFDSVSVFYVNIPFLLASLLPFRFRANIKYQKFLLWLFVITNAAGLILAVADIVYYPFKLARIASDDLVLTQEGNFGSLMLTFLVDYWWGFIIYFVMVAALWRGFKIIKYQQATIKNNLAYYTSQAALLLVAAVVAVVLIRGNAIKGTYPISPSEATKYARPELISLVQSNPFMLVRTIGSKDKLEIPKYMDDNVADSIFNPIQTVQNSSMLGERKPNIVMIILESFGTAHIKSLSEVYPKERVSQTPFLDSLINHGFVFTNTYQTGRRSIDAMPSIWASLPSFKLQFLSFPHAASSAIHGLPDALSEMGYSSAFLHGGSNRSMNFQSFGLQCGVSEFWFREDYEKEFGTKGFDNHWGIFDHVFLPYAADKISTLKEPFFATVFTLSSHHPYVIPDEFKGKFPKGTTEIDETIAYSDHALKIFFEQISKKPFFNNTLFIFVADHASGADNEVYKKVPRNYRIPLLFYMADGTFKGRSDKMAKHLDLMPTLLGLIGYDKPFFSFGRNLFDPTTNPRGIIYSNGTFNMVTDSLVVMFDEKKIIGAYNYINDPMIENNIADKLSEQELNVDYIKAYIQQYYRYVKQRNFTANNNSNQPK